MFTYTYKDILINILPNIVAYLVLVVVFGAIYSSIPEDFGFEDKIDPYYFSSTTISSVGYGDYSPKTQRAKIIVMLQQCCVVLNTYAVLDAFLYGFIEKKE